LSSLATSFHHPRTFVVGLDLSTSTILPNAFP
jgi:hypothetical protein